MEPYGERIAVSARGSAFRGSLSRLIGQLAAMLGDTDAADAHYIQARHLDERLGAPTWVAHDLWRHGELRLAVGDGPGAIRLLERAVATARAAGLQEGLARIEQAKAIAQASLGRRH
jgi:predicted RNA polymerase sigma factor